MELHSPIPTINKLDIRIDIRPAPPAPRNNRVRHKRDLVVRAHLSSLHLALPLPLPRRALLALLALPTTLRLGVLHTAALHTPIRRDHERKRDLALREQARRGRNRVERRALVARVRVRIRVVRDARVVRQPDFGWRAGELARLGGRREQVCRDELVGPLSREAERAHLVAERIDACGRSRGVVGLGAWDGLAIAAWLTVKNFMRKRESGKKQQLLTVRTVRLRFTRQAGGEELATRLGLLGAKCAAHDGHLARGHEASQATAGHARPRRRVRCWCPSLVHTAAVAHRTAAATADGGVGTPVVGLGLAWGILATFAVGGARGGDAGRRGGGGGGLIGQGLVVLAWGRGVVGRGGVRGV